MVGNLITQSFWDCVIKFYKRKEALFVGKIKMNKVSKDYKTNSQLVRALNRVTLEIKVGTSVAIRGKSGSGKSTVLNILAGIIEPTEGDVWYGETNICRLSEKARCDFRTQNIGIVFQSFQLLEELTVYENICFPIYLQNKNIDEKKIKTLIEIVGLEHKTDVYPNQLSGGEQQRVAIARAFASNPKIVLADEPTGNLDEATSSQIIDLFLKCKEIYEQTLIVVTHDDDVAKKMNRIITLRDGTIIHDTEGTYE